MSANPVNQRQKILIVDDDPGMVHLLARTLLDMAQLHFAVRGDDALNKLAQHRPDLLLIDVELPDLDGYEVVRRLRADPMLGDTPVAMITSHNTDAYRQRALEVGAVDFFTKPIDRDLIRMRVEQLLSAEPIESIELDEYGGATQPMPLGGLPAVAPPQPAVPHSADMAQVHAITSELFERMSAILSQAETLRERSGDRPDPGTLYPIQRIEEECAEVIQLLVSLSGED